GFDVLVGADHQGQQQDHEGGADEAEEQAHAATVKRRRRPTYQPVSRTQSPVAAKPAVAAARIHFSGRRRAAAAPSSTDGALTSIMPSVEPASNGRTMEKRAARAAVATWVLSPISMTKKAAAVVQNTPAKVFSVVSGRSSNRSGIRAQTAKARKARPTTQRTHSPCIQCDSTAPAAAANRWLPRVATRMPSRMGRGRRQAAARTMASSMVLSPISAMETRPAEIRK